MGTLAFAALASVALAAGGATLVQTGPGRTGDVAPELGAPAPGQLLNKDYTTSTGETVPRPGVPQASGPTPLDRSIERQDNQIDKRICGNC